MTARGSKESNKSNEQNERSKQLYAYMEEQGLVEAFKKVMSDMFDMDPDLPTDPIKYIKENTGYTMKEAREAIKELKKLQLTTEVLEGENELLKNYLENVEKDEGSDRWSSESEAKKDEKIEEKKDEKKEKKKT